MQAKANPRTTGISHNYELFEFAKILSVKNVKSSSDPARPKVAPPHIRCVKAGGWQDHSVIAMALSNGYIVVRYVGASGTPLIHNVRWYKPERSRILDMDWCPDAHHLIVLTADMTIMLLPIINIILGKNTGKQEARTETGTRVYGAKKPVIKVDPLAPIGRDSHLGPSDDITIYNNITKATKIHATGHIFWWRTTDRVDYAVTVSERGTVRFINLHTHEMRKEHIIRLDLNVAQCQYIDNKNGSKFIVIQDQNGKLGKVQLEKPTKTGGITIFGLLDMKPPRPVVSQLFGRIADKRGVRLSVNSTRRGTLVGMYFPSTNKLEVHSADMRSYPLYVYQLVSRTTFTHLTDKLTFAVSHSDEERASSVYVISNWIASTSDSPDQYYFKHQRESIMQEFKFRGQRIRGCFRAFGPKDPLRAPPPTELEGFFVWTRDGIYECRPKIPAKTIFYRLLAQGREKTDAEPLGTTVGLDILQLYETAADTYFEKGNHGRALDLYFLSNVKIYKLVYKFLEVDRMDIILVHLNSLVLKQAESLSVTERNILSDLLLYCHIYRIAILNEGKKVRSDTVQEFHQFLDHCKSYDHAKAVESLLRLGMIEDMFKVWRTDGCPLASCIEILTQGEYMDLSNSIIHSLIPLLKENEEFASKQYVLFHSPFFRSLPVDEQVKIILEDNAFIKANIKVIVDAIPLLHEESLIELVSTFDPFGQKFRKIELETEPHSTHKQQSYDQISVDGTPYMASADDATELFLQALLCLCYRISKKKEGNENISVVVSPREETNERKLTLSHCFLQEAQKVKRISCGCNHIVALTDGGQVYAWGSNESGQLGVGKSITAIDQPSRIESLEGTKITHVACGGEYTLVATGTNQIYSWGKGNCGQLGYPSKKSIFEPRIIPSFAHENMEVQQIACGIHHSAVLSNEGELWVFGEGMLGNGSKSSSVPVLIEDIEGGEQVACGWAHTVVLTHHGEVYSWGDGSYGQLGHGDTEDVSRPKLIDALQRKDIKKIGCGYFHTLAITDLHNLYSWGRGSHGKLGHGSMDNLLSPQLVNEFVLTKVVDVDAGYCQSISLTDKGYAYAWGSRKRGQLGFGDLEEPGSEPPSPIAVPTKLKALENHFISQICCADDHCAAITEKNELFVWGVDISGKKEYNDPPILIEIKETLKFRVLEETDKEEDNGSERYQRLLEDTLEKKFSHYRPSMLLRQCADYNNWRAASSIYRELKDYRAAVRCLTRTVNPEDKENAAKNILYQHAKIFQVKLQEKDCAIAIQELFSFWSEHHFDRALLDSYILDHIDNTADGIHNLIARSTNVPISSHVLLAVSRYRLEQIKQVFLKPSTVPEESIWDQIMKNIEKSIDNNQIIVNKEKIRKLKKNGSDQRKERKDCIAFTCGHSFSVSEYYEKHITDFYNRIGKSKAPQSGTLIWEDLTRPPTAHSCPDCTYASFQQYIEECARK